MWEQLVLRPGKAWRALQGRPHSHGGPPSRAIFQRSVTELMAVTGKEPAQAPGTSAGGRGGAGRDHIYHCGFLQWSHLVPGEVDAACPSACWMRGLLPGGQRGWSRGRGHRRQREGTPPSLLSLLHTLWRETKSERLHGPALRARTPPAEGCT